MPQLRNVELRGIGVVSARGDFGLRTPLRPNSTVPGARAIAEFDLKNYAVSPKTYLDRCSALALAGCSLALGDAQMPVPLENTERFGIVLGTHLGCVATMKGFWDKVEEKGVRGANSILFSHSYINSPISLCAIEWNLRGYHSTVCSENRSGLDAVRTAWEAIALGHADTMLCGGVEALTPEGAQLQENETASEASVFFVLQAQDETLRGQLLTPAFFDAVNDSHLRETASRWGDCGGATGALALLETLAT
ncbi:MAG TPA: beta-ketoacyl synthase N-terminal-like domain-containing protein [Abditibacteriaceae bacterium]|jgi:3-oxoacyl-(acyl-carrier-protein) synthase